MVCPVLGVELAHNKAMLSSTALLLPALLLLLPPELAAAALYAMPVLPTGPRAPVVIPQAPSPTWSWDRIPTSFHGAVKDRTFSDAEVDRLGYYQMITIEKWYTPCGSAPAPHQSGPECAVELKAEHLFGRIRAAAAGRGLPRPTAILYWNSMFDFAMYAAHQGMLDLEAAGVHAFLRDETGRVISLCNDGTALSGSISAVLTGLSWICVGIRGRRALASPVCA